MADEPTLPADEQLPETRRTGFPAVKVAGEIEPRDEASMRVKTGVKAGNDDPHGHFAT